jgi:hypothetical protein
MSIIVECVGWLGAILVLLAYILISTNKIESSTPIFQWLNLVGAICLIVHTIYNHAYPSAFVNIVWTGVAIYGLLKGRLID